MTKKILLVNNNREYRHTMASMVRRVGYDVIQAEEIAEAIERSANDRPDLVMMADGVEVAAWLKTNEFPGRIPIVVYTAQQTAIVERRRSHSNQAHLFRRRGRCVAQTSAYFQKQAAANSIALLCE